MRSRSGLVGCCVLLVGSQALVGCGDDDPATPFTPPPSGGSSSTAGKGPGGSSTGGSDAQAGTAGTFGQAGTVSGGSAGMGGGGSGGMAGTAGTGPQPACTVDATCADTDVCTDDKCVDGECVHTDNTATCDDGNVCTSDDKCAAGECKGTNNTVNCDDLSSCTAGQDKCAEGKCGGTRDLTLCPACAVAGNLIQNCDFTDDLEHWAAGITFGGSATQTVVNEVNVIDITSGGAEIFAVQPRQEPLTLKQGMKYQLRLLAGASVNRKMTVSLTKNVAPYAIYSRGGAPGGGYELDLTKDMKPFDFEFVMPGKITTEQPIPTGDDNEVKLEIKVGGAAGNPSKVYFDDVYLVEKKCDANPACDDGNSCTTDVCDVAKGTCSWTVLANDAPCATDNESCTVDTCQEGVCEHAALEDGDDCDDEGDECTADTCTAGVCGHKYDTVACDCVLDAHCDDGELCTTDVCKDDGTCSTVPNTLPCDDGEFCTSNDKCAAGECGGTPNTLACDDGNACTSADVCAAGDCGGTNNTAVCNDNDPCTVMNMCAAGVCSPGTNKCFDCTADGNILKNCNFATGIANWATGITFNGGAATQTVEGGLLKVVTTVSGNDPYMVQPRQEGITLLPSTRYVVRLNAYASVPRPIVASVTQNSDPFTSISGGKIINITGEMDEYTFTFDTGVTVPALIKLELDLGGTANNAVLPNTVYIDNVSLVGTAIP